ncbi:hypothetical protein RZS08_56960, partial [Arthrospira platensis SPKY1]|nr:hypothetical protein [Arthrospira platensis SPKY1]
SALADHERLIRSREGASRSNPLFPGHKIALAEAHCGRARLLDALGRREPALDDYALAFELLESLDLSIRRVRDKLAELCMRRATLFESIGQDDLALEDFGRAVSLRE